MWINFNSHQDASRPVSGDTRVEIEVLRGDKMTGYAKKFHWQVGSGQYNSIVRFRRFCPTCGELKTWPLKAGE